MLKIPFALCALAIVSCKTTQSNLAEAGGGTVACERTAKEARESTRVLSALAELAVNKSVEPVQNAALVVYQKATSPNELSIEVAANQIGSRYIEQSGEFTKPQIDPIAQTPPEVIEKTLNEVRNRPGNMGDGIILTASRNNPEAIIAGTIIAAGASCNVGCENAYRKIQEHLLKAVNSITPDSKADLRLAAGQLAVAAGANLGNETVGRSIQQSVGLSGAEMKAGALLEIASLMLQSPGTDFERQELQKRIENLERMGGVTRKNLDLKNTNAIQESIRRATNLQENAIRRNQDRMIQFKRAAFSK